MSTSCTAVRNHLLYVPVSHLKTGIQGPTNIISLRPQKLLLRKKKVISSNYSFILLITLHENLL